MHVVVAGNPGVGKSAILNSLVGSVKFKSGLSFGSGKTKLLQTAKSKGVKYSDTPGLADTNMREKAAQEISKAFQEGGEFKLIFVVLTVAGRVRPDDLATINIILRAIEDVGIDTRQKYSIIVNKCGPRLLSLLDEKENRAKVEIPFGVPRKVNHIGYFPLVQEATEADDYMLSDGLADTCFSFVDSAPVFKLRANSGLTVKAEAYRETAAALAKQLEDLYRTLEEAKKKKKDPKFWAKVALKMHSSDTGELKAMMELLDQIGGKAPFIMKLKKAL